jgi:hypothetical protein
MRNFETIKKYLPSKKFVLIFLAIVIFILLYMGISSFIEKRKESKITKKEQIEKFTGLTVADLVSQDTDGDGVVDWEESLWGTDKNNKFTFNGILDSEYINRKKSELNFENKIDESNLSETDKFAREFFSAFMAMKEGGVDNLTINNFASSIGQNLVSVNNITNEFTEENIKTSSSVSVEEYFSKMRSIFEKYSKIGLGDEMQLLETNLNQYTATGVETNTEKIQSIGLAYQEFAKEASKITSPESISNIHINIINSANKTGISVLSFSKVLNDPVLGVTGLTQYEKNIDEFVKSVTELETLIESGI